MMEKTIIKSMIKNMNNKDLKFLKKIIDKRLDNE